MDLDFDQEKGRQKMKDLLKVYEEEDDDDEMEDVCVCV